MQFALVLSLTLLFITSYVVADSIRPKQELTADLVYFNGSIITIDQRQPTADFVAVKNGKIIEVSPQMSGMASYVGQNTVVVNLNGKTLIPGFIDAHSHFSKTAISLSLGFSITSPPFGNVNSIAQILDNIKRYITSNKIPKGQKVYGAGYSDQGVRQHRHPTRFELDSVSTEHPILLRHYSGHVVVANTLALSLVGFNDHTKDPRGGSLDRFSNKSLTGVAREVAIVPLLNSFQVSFLQLTTQQIQKTVDVYFEAGITTAYDALLSMDEPTVYKSLGDNFPIDINAYFWINSPNLTNYSNVMANYSTLRFKPRGAKLIIDGSIQAYTAYLSTPYWVPQANQYDNLNNYIYNKTRSCQTESCGLKDFPNTWLLHSLFMTLHNQEADVMAHCNGDKAIDIYLDALEQVRNTRQKQSSSRFIIMHAQTIRQDQLDRMVRLNAYPSFFAPQIYYWGDLHYKIYLGPDRANRMNPVKSAVNRNLIYSLHNDSPVIPMWKINGRNTFLQTLDSAINRVTSGGRVLGEDQRITAYEALKGVTINAAIQLGEEERKGSITVGKMADMIILSGNPLLHNGAYIKFLQVVTTIKEGKVVYGRYP